jgi:Phytanoyl-CoA dioxygenase (PhyH)
LLNNPLYLIEAATQLEVTLNLDDLLYRYDLKGYVVIPEALSAAHVEQLLESWEERLVGKSLFDISFDWGPEWAGLIDPEPVVTVLNVLFQHQFRLDHAFCVNENFGNSQGGMHHGGLQFDRGLFHVTNADQFASGLVGIIYHLTDVTPTTPGFCCIPGTHKQHRNTPARYMSIYDNDLLERAFLKRGDAILFNEALTHGTYLVEGRTKRRCAMFKYCYSYAAFRQPAACSPIAALASTPNHDHFAWEGKLSADKLTDRQCKIAAYPPYSRGREPLL